MRIAEAEKRGLVASKVSTERLIAQLEGLMKTAPAESPIVTAANVAGDAERAELAKKRRVPPYVVAHDSTLLAMATARPSDVHALRSVPGMGPYRIEALGDAACARAAAGDVLIVQGDLLDRYPVLARSAAMVVADLYDPYHLEALEQSAHLPGARRRATIAASVAAIGTLLARGDVFLGAGGHQRDLWVGALAAAGRVNEFTYADSPDLSRLLLDVPFGIAAAAPVAADAPVLRGVEPGIGADDLLLWWGGGIHPWFDPTTVIDATARLVAEGLLVCLVVAGARHPNPDVGETAAARAAREHVRAVGAEDAVRFLDWVPFAERGAYLLEADVMVSAHRDHVETRYSYRTRLLDGLWAGRPTVATGGDVLMDAIAAAGAGIAVAPGDVAEGATPQDVCATGYTCEVACRSDADCPAIARFCCPQVLIDWKRCQPTSC